MPVKAIKRTDAFGKAMLEVYDNSADLESYVPDVISVIENDFAGQGGEVIDAVAVTLINYRIRGIHLQIGYGPMGGLDVSCSDEPLLDEILLTLKRKFSL